MNLSQALEEKPDMPGICTGGGQGRVQIERGRPGAHAIIRACGHLMFSG